MIIIILDKIILASIKIKVVSTTKTLGIINSLLPKFFFFFFFENST